MDKENYEKVISYPLYGSLVSFLFSLNFLYFSFYVSLMAPVNQRSLFAGIILFFLFCGSIFFTLGTSTKIRINDKGIRKTLFKYVLTEIEWNNVYRIRVKKMPNVVIPYRSSSMKCYFIEKLENKKIKRINFVDARNGIKDILEFVNKYVQIHNINLIAIERKGVETHLDSL